MSHIARIIDPSFGTLNNQSTQAEAQITAKSGTNKEDKMFMAGDINIEDEWNSTVVSFLRVEKSSGFMTFYS